MDVMASMPTRTATAAQEATAILPKPVTPHLVMAELLVKDTADPTLLLLPHQEILMEALVATIWEGWEINPTKTRPREERRA